jgi:hypothetical protein
MVRPAMHLHRPVTRFALLTMRVLLLLVIPGQREALNPESRSVLSDNFEIPGSRCARPGMTRLERYRTSSLIAPSRPSIVIGYMRLANRRRMMVVDSE